MGKSYEQGKLDGLKLFGDVCSRQADCESCLVGRIRGDGLSCQEFMSKFPSKMLSILSDMDSESYTFFDEYVTRFPNCGLTVDELSDIVCRKAVFEGYVGCEGGDCKACWQETYIDDITETAEDSDD